MGQWWVITEDNEGSITKPERFFRSNSDNCRKQAISHVMPYRPLPATAIGRVDVITYQLAMLRQ